MTTLIQGILNLINTNDQVEGTEVLTLELTTINTKATIRDYARRLQDEGAIIIIPSKGGRGNKTVYKRNRNQPGLPRKTR